MYTNLRECLADLEQSGRLRVIDHEVDPNLEMASMQLEEYERQGPALWFKRVKGSPFSAVSNLFGTVERSEFVFRKTMPLVETAVRLKANPMTFLSQLPTEFLKDPGTYFKLPFTGFASLPKKISCDAAPVMKNVTSIDQLPQIKSWPKDGGAFITLPQVFSKDVDARNIMQSNLGMYRVQMSGNDYAPNREIGLHYQIHRGIGVHHSGYLQRNEPMKVSIFVGGPPAHTVAAVMPMPEGLSELVFAGMLAGRRFRYCEKDGYVISADADFVITGTVTHETKPEGPFGDHLGYYSLIHDFPVMKVDKVYHREGAIWPFTVVGRPPQEDTSFGKLIHRMTKPMVPVSIPGLRAMHAVDEAGVHPLLLALGEERYVPYKRTGPQELLTIANAVLGFNQASLAKYLCITAPDEDGSVPDIDDTMGFLRWILERIDWRRDLHFQTSTTIDTLDYSGEGFNQGSKVVLAALGPVKRTLGETRPDLASQFFSDPKLVAPGIVAVKAPNFESYEHSSLAPYVDQLAFGAEFPLVVVVDDPAFVAETSKNFLWATFTRSNPSHDIYGVGASTLHKHWGCGENLVIDARRKPFHAPELER